MGCASAMFGSYTAEELQAEVAKTAPLLPVAVLMNGGIIKLEGANGIFNPNSLLDPNWLKGRMTAEDYTQAINYINQCACQTHVGLSKMYSTTERAMRLGLLTSAGMAAVQQINQRFTAIRFTYQQTAENIEMNTSYRTDTMSRYAQRNGPPVANSTKTIIYIAPT